MKTAHHPLVLPVYVAWPLDRWVYIKWTWFCSGYSSLPQSSGDFICWLLLYFWLCCFSEQFCSIGESVVTISIRLSVSNYSLFLILLCFSFIIFLNNIKQPGNIYRVPVCFFCFMIFISQKLFDFELLVMPCCGIIDWTLQSYLVQLHSLGYGFLMMTFSSVFISALCVNVCGIYNFFVSHVFPQKQSWVSWLTVFNLWPFRTKGSVAFWLCKH